ncbi:MAG TPA: hypothetical protein VND45_04505 [Thermoanaerobaculia bacterium]|jgi:opacity protein-like surface antigen|nr:hypothetical protein [Thermoanaerobaculia bacterium]
MRRLLLLLLLATPLTAAEIEAGVAHVAALARKQGDLTIEMGRGFGAEVEVFWSDVLSTRAAATFVNPAVYTSRVDLGTLGLDIYSASARWHLRPHSHLSPFAGAGGAFVVIGDLDDRFGDEVKIEFDAKVAPLVEGGLRYRVHPRIALELGATYMPLEAEGDVAFPDIPRRIAVDPLIVSAGASWRF